MLQEIWKNLYEQVSIEDINKLYTKTGCYVFKRPMHEPSQYYSYLRANKQLSTAVTVSSPAFPTWLLPPNLIIEQLEKSPKLTLKENFRKDNWQSIIGEFECFLDDLNVNKKQLSDEHKLINYLTQTKGIINKDNNIYSIWYIEKISNTKFYCCHLKDITQKLNGNYSKKSDQYSQYIQCYTASIEKSFDGYYDAQFGKC